MLELTKARITAFVALTGAAGYILYRERIDFGIWVPMLGLFLLACGSAALNQYQERAVDARMPRTRGRPIPSGALRSATALQIVVVLVLAGSLILLWGGNLTSFLLGLLALVWYNGVYLYLKKQSAFAVVPGSLVGAISPLAGWTAAGGQWTDPKILAVAGFFFIWQIPHFWLLLLKYGKEYEAVGYPSLTQLFNAQQISRLTFVWTVATVVTGLIVVPAWGRPHHPVVTLVALFVAGVWLAYRNIPLVRDVGEKFSVKRAFMDINLYALIVTMVLIIDSLWDSLWQ